MDMFKAIKNICIMIMLSLSLGVIAGCCDTSVTLNVVFKDVEPELGYTDYTEELSLGEGKTFEFDIPAGYDHEGFAVTLNGKQKIEWEVTYANPEIEEQYRYTVAKKITFSFAKILNDYDLEIDMSKVKKRPLKLNISSNILDMAKSKDKQGRVVSNLSIITINPDKINKLLRLDASNIVEERKVYEDYGTAYYGEYVALVYSKPSGNGEIGSIYTNVNHFTKEEDVLTIGNIKYCQYNVAKRGNSFYNVYTGEAALTNTRIFYLGMISEGFNIYNAIPNYEVPRGHVLEDEENKFSLLTNIQDFNSELLDISVYKPSTKEYDAQDPNMDKVGDVVLEKMSPAEDIFAKRYNRYDMYIGDDIVNDNFITEEEKSTIPSEMYVLVKTELNKETGGRIDDYLNIRLMHYEKQPGVGFLEFDEYLESENGFEFLKINNEVIAQFIDKKVNYQENEYLTGNAVLFVAIDQGYIDRGRDDDTLQYSAIYYPVFHGGTFHGVDHSYSMQFYILNDDQTKDYGFLDMQAYEQDIVFFRTDKLYKNGVYQNNLYFDIVGAEFNSFHSPIINRIYIKRGDVYIGPSTGISVVGGGYFDVVDAQVLNGVQGLPIQLGDQDAGDQYTLMINLIVTGNSSDKHDVDFSNLTFQDMYTDVIFITNNFNISKWEDFEQIYYTSKNNNLGLKFGYNSELYYFVVAGTPTNFDIYVGDNQEDNKVTSSKKLLDIAGNTVRINMGSTDYEVYIMYQSENIYGGIGSSSFVAYNYSRPNE